MFYLNIRNAFDNTLTGLIHLESAIVRSAADLP